MVRSSELASCWLRRPGEKKEVGQKAVSRCSQHHLWTVANERPAMSLSPEQLKSLEHEYSLLRLFHHRNKNQHRVATWWKHLNTLKRDLTKLVVLLKTNKKKPEKVRETVLCLGHRILGVDVKNCYRAFNGIIALGQFVTLGLTLLGMLAKLNSCVGNIEGLDEYVLEKRRSGSTDMTKRQGVVEIAFGFGDDLGEEIGEVVTVDDAGTKNFLVKEKKRKSGEESSGSGTKKKKIKSKDLDAGSKMTSSDGEKKKKKKKKKSAIDDIFG